MPRHLKTHVLSRLNGAISYFLPPSDVSALHKRGVRYFVPVDGIEAFWGAMNTVKEGRRYRKHIIVRHAPEHHGLLQLYTYHFPKHWSAACVANRELIKEAQRQAHALEHDHSIEALEWRVRSFKHYYTVFKGGAKPEPGMKPYSRFYQYTYVAIYRELKAEAERAKEEQETSCVAEERLKRISEEISFEPVEFHLTKPHFSTPCRRAYNYFWERNLQPPDIQDVMNPPKIPRTTAKFAYVREKQ